MSKQAWRLRILVTITVILLCIPPTAGCESSYTKQFQIGENNYGSRTGHEQHKLDGPLAYGLTVPGGNNHNNKSLRYNKEISAAVSDMPGVFVAIVMETDKNAYAAIVYDGSGTGTKANGHRGNETDNTGETRGMYDTYTGNSYADPNKIVTGINGYFTAVDEKDLSRLFKQSIAVEIRKHNPNLKEVHISANRDFVNQMNVYLGESRNGVDLQLYLPDFNAIAKRLFGETPRLDDRKPDATENER